MLDMLMTVRGFDTCLKHGEPVLNSIVPTEKHPFCLDQNLTILENKIK